VCSTRQLQEQQQPTPQQRRSQQQEERCKETSVRQLLRRRPPDHTPASDGLGRHWWGGVTGGTVVELGARWVALLAGGGAAGVGCAARLPAAAAAVRPLRLPPLLPSGCAPAGAASVTAVQLHRLGRKDSSARAARRIRARCAVDIALAALASQSGPARCRVKAPRAVECSGAACAVQWS
jgi:hypothetical protein